MLKEKRGRNERERELRAVKRGTVVRGSELEEVEGRKSSLSVSRYLPFPQLVLAT